MDKYIQTTTCPETCLTCSVCRNHIPVLCSVMTYQQVCNKSKTMGATCGAGTAYPYGWPEFTPVVSGVRFVRSLVFCVLFCRSLFVLFLLAIVLSMLWFMASDYPFGIFWPLCCLCFDLWLLITPLVSSNFSYILIKQYKNKQKKRFPSIYFVKTSRPIGMHSSNNQIINWKSTVFFPLNIITRLRAIHQK